MRERTGLFGLIRSRAPPVSGRHAVFRPSRLPLPVTEAGSSSREPWLSFRDDSIVTCPARAGRLPGGSVPLRDISYRSPLSTRIPASPMFRPQRFARSRRFAPPIASWACFIPLPRPGFRFRGFLPPDRSRRLVAVASLLAVGTELLPSLARWRRLPARRPRGLSCLVIRKLRRGCWPRADSVSPPAFRLLRVSSSRTLVGCPTSARDLHVSGLRVPGGAGPQRLDRS